MGSDSEQVISVDVQVLRDELERFCQGGLLRLVERMENSMRKELNVRTDPPQQQHSKPQTRGVSVYRDGTLLSPETSVAIKTIHNVEDENKDAAKQLLSRKSIQSRGEEVNKSARASYLMPTTKRSSLGPQQASSVVNADHVLLSEPEHESTRSLEMIAPEEDGAKTPFCDLQAFICSEVFDYIVGCLILLNSVCIGLSTNYSAVYWTSEGPLFFNVSSHLFNWIFFLELVLRLYAYGNTFASYAARNVLDCVIVVAGMADEACTFLSKTNHFSKGLSVLRIVRVLRLIRIIRLARVLILFGELRVLVASVLDSMRALGWTLFLILLLTYTFAVYVTQLITDQKMVDNGDTFANGEGEALLKAFGSVPQSMLSLYEAILGGVDWGEMVALVIKYCSVFDALVLISYMTFSTLALMNVVTATFVASAMKNGDEDRRTILGRQMTQFFNDADDDESGTITWEEFSAKLDDPTFNQFLREIDLRPSQAEALYRLLDEDTTGDVAIEDLVSGCIRLDGVAKSIDLLSFVRSAEHQWIKANKDLAIVNENVINSVVALESALT